MVLQVVVVGMSRGHVRSLGAVVIVVEVASVSMGFVDYGARWEGIHLYRGYELTQHSHTHSRQD